MPLKKCLKCGNAVGVKSKQCTCGHKFPIKKRPDKPADVDWRELKRGDKIKSFNCHGPYRKNSLNETIYMGHYGELVVHSIDSVGIHCYGEHGHVYLYMGVDAIGVTGTNLSSHKVKRLK